MSDNTVYSIKNGTKKASSSLSTSTKDNKPAYLAGDGGISVTTAGKAFRQMIEAEFREEAKYRNTFNEMLVQLMKDRGLHREELAKATGISPETVKLMRNDAAKQFSIRFVVAVCIAMHLPPVISDKLIECSPSKFLDTVEMCAYRHVLHHCYQMSVGQVNRMLIEAGFAPLTSLVDGYNDGNE